MQDNDNTPKIDLFQATQDKTGSLQSFFMLSP